MKYIATIPLFKEFVIDDDGMLLEIFTDIRSVRQFTGELIFSSSELAVPKLKRYSDE